MNTGPEGVNIEPDAMSNGARAVTLDSVAVDSRLDDVSNGPKVGSECWAGGCVKRVKGHETCAQGSVKWAYGRGSWA